MLENSTDYRNVVIWCRFSEQFWSYYKSKNLFLWKTSENIKLIVSFQNLARLTVYYVKSAWCECSVSKTWRTMADQSRGEVASVSLPSSEEKLQPMLVTWLAKMQKSSLVMPVVILIEQLTEKHCHSNARRASKLCRSEGLLKENCASVMIGSSVLEKDNLLPSLR